MELVGRVALVTGAGRRLGRAMAVALGGRGCAVAVHYHRSAAGAADVVRDITAAGAAAHAFAADLREAEAPRALVSAVVARFGRMDVLVNSAAVMRRAPLESIDVAAWDETFALNLRAPFFLAQAAAAELRRRQGAIVNIADLAAFETWPGYLPHGIAKAGIVQMTRGLARVLAPDVRVNAIAPGAVLLPDDWSGEDARRLTASTPLGRLGSPDDVTGALLFLLDADYITGETIIVDGGRRVRR